MHTSCSCLGSFNFLSSLLPFFLTFEVPNLCSRMIGLKSIENYQRQYVDFTALNCACLKF